MPDWREDVHAQVVERLRATLPSDVSVFEMGTEEETEPRLSKLPVVFVGFPALESQAPVAHARPELQNRILTWRVLVAGNRRDVAPADRSVLAVLGMVDNALRGWRPAGHPGSVFVHVSEQVWRYLYQGAIYVQEWRQWRQGT